MADAIRDWLTIAGRYPLLSAEEERSLLIAAKQGSEQAKKRLISCNLRLAISEAKQHQGRGVEFEDLIQEANMGLLDAIRDFDLSRGRFTTYAVWKIKGRVYRAINNTSRTIRLPCHVYDDLRTIRKHIRQLSQKLGRMPTLTEIATATNRKAEWILSRLEADRFTDSLDRLAFSSNQDGREEAIGGFVAGPEDVWQNAIESVDRDLLKQLLNTLTPREAEVLRLRYGLNGSEPESYERIGNKFNLSRERVRQLEARAIQRLRHLAYPDEPMKDFYELDSPADRKRDRAAISRQIQAMVKERTLLSKAQICRLAGVSSDYLTTDKLARSEYDKAVAEIRERLKPTIALKSLRVSEQELQQKLQAIEAEIIRLGGDRMETIANLHSVRNQITAITGANHVSKV